MTFDLARLLRIYQFTTTRRTKALELMLEAAVVLGLTTLNHEIRAAIEADEQTLELEEHYVPRRKRKHGDRARILDIELIESLSAFHKLLESRTILHGPNRPKGKLAEGLRQAIFPKGLKEISRRSFADTHELIGRRLARIRRDANLSRAVSFLRLEEFLADFESLNNAFGAEINAFIPLNISGREIQARNAQGQDRLCRIVFRAIGSFPGPSRGDTVRREALIAGVYQENEAIAQENKARARKRRANNDNHP